jgi:mRNA interferase RelE/StbE
MYAVEFAPSAARAFRKLESAVQRRIASAIDALALRPRPAGAVKLAGGDDTFRIRVGDYRVVYIVENRILRVVIVRVAHRKEAYR